MRIDDFTFMELKIAVLSKNYDKAMEIITATEKEHEKKQLLRDIYSVYKRTGAKEFLETYKEIKNS